MRRPLLVAAATALTIVCSAMSATSVHAASNGSTSFFPSTTGAGPRLFFVYSLKPGARTVDHAVLTNQTSRSVGYRIYAGDASDVSGAFTIAGPNDVAHDAGSWISVPVHHLVLRAHTRRTIPITITVPTNATPGDHAAGVVALPTATAQIGRSNIKLRARYGVGIRVYLRVAGPVAPRVSLTKMSLSTSGGLFGALLGHKQATVDYTATNTGNLRLTPTGQAKFSTHLGSKTAPLQQLGELLPGSSAVTSATVSGLRWGSLLGVVHAKVTISGPGVPTETATTSAFTFPWLLVLLLIVVIGGAIYLRKRRRHSGRHGADPPGQNGSPTDELVEA